MIRFRFETVVSAITVVLIAAVVGSYVTCQVRSHATRNECEEHGRVETYDCDLSSRAIGRMECKWRCVYSTPEADR
jgi:hypothetical protein